MEILVVYGKSSTQNAFAIKQIWCLRKPDGPTRINAEAFEMQQTEK